LKAVVLDLRNNPGGLLSAAVESADLFLNQGLIVTTKSRSEEINNFKHFLQMTFKI
jgi:carboxyl-terminal processing protease